MEEKESPVSGSTGGISEAELPAVSGGAVACGVGGGALAQVMNFSVNMNVDGSLGPSTGGGGVLAFGGGGSGDLLVKKKRGRPRKYDADGNLRVPYKSPPAPGFCFSSPSSAEFSSSKRGRGRPPGSGNWQMLASLGELFAQTAGGDFTPHVVTVSTGEDVAAKIISFSLKGPRGVCVLSANGAVSNVTIRQPGSSGGLLTYEGRFEILSLTGSYTVTENGGVRSRSGGLSVSLASPDGRVIGGGVAGLLVAASPIQMVVGSFKPNGLKTHKRKHYYEPRTTPFIPGSSDTATPATPISQAAPNTDSYPILTSQLPVQSHGEADNNMSDGQNPNTSSDSGDWNGSDPHSAPRTYPDINVSVLVD